MELEMILERLRIVTGQKSDRAMCIHIGLKESISGAWKRRNTIPYEACFIAAEKTGYNAEWILTGKGAQKHGDPTPPEINEEHLISDFIETVENAIQMDILKEADSYNDESIKMIAKLMLSRTLKNQEAKSK